MSNRDDAPTESEQFTVGIDGFEGPLDLLLALARTHKVDLQHVSILALVEQYLVFIAELRRLKLEVAADYLVMAAWLAFLKSRLLLPREDEPETASAEEMAQRLSFRLMRLEAMRNAAGQLMTRHRLDRDVFARGLPERVTTNRETTFTADVYDLLKAYADQRRKTIKTVHVVKARKVWSVKEARRRLESLIGATATGDWAQLDLFIEHYLPKGEEERTVVASSFGATLEMAREGLVELRQEAPFAPIYMRKKAAGAAWERLG